MIPRNFLLITIILFILSSCGLYDYPYLDAPGVNTVKGSGNAEIYNSSSNDPDVFRGYELYYKYYDGTTSTTEIAEDDENIFSTSDPEPSDLTSEGYRRVNTVETTDDSTPYPMIPVDYSDRDSSFTLTVYFNDVGVGTKPYVIYSGYSDVTLYRNVTEEFSGTYNYKSFISADHDSGDADLPADDLTLSLYVFSYGKSDNVKIYSKPVWLGKINY